MKDSPIYWRFNQTESKDLEIKHNSIEHSIELWNSRVSSQYDHLMRIPSNWDENWIECKKIDVDTDQIENGRRLLNVIDHDKDILFFWSRKYSLSVDWCFFVNHWTDFCYPDDDSIAMLIKNDRLLTFCEETLTLYCKK